MRFGRYAVSWHTLLAVRRMTRDVRRVRKSGIPRVEHESHAGLAASVLQANARPTMFVAGAGHFHRMWPTDFGKAFGGCVHALPHDYLASLVSRIVKTGARLRYVPTCFTPKSYYDLPWPRGDNVPWLLHMVDLLDDEEFVKEHRADLQTVYADWVAAHVEEKNGLLHERVWGDWMDTVPRPSSTYNNLIAIRGYEVADKLGLDRAPTYRKEAEQALLDERWAGWYLRDHAGADDYLSADANVPALYLGVLPEWARERMASAIETSPLLDPVPMRTREGEYPRDKLPWLTRMVPSYHHITWLHLGIMYLNGLKRLGRPYAHHLEKVDAAVAKYGNFLETLEADGTPHRSWLMTTEYGFSMSAGQYLELTGPDQAVDSVVQAGGPVRVTLVDA